MNAAASGAVDFGNWCKGQQIDTVVLTDRNDAKVRIQDIRTTIRTFVEKRTYSQLILFFAGHGILKAPDDEYWLLSDAPGNEYEAVNVVQSVANARNNPFKHVVFISDACRSLPGTYRLTAVKGMAVFPNSGLTQARPKIDQFYATAPSDPAYEAELEDALSFAGIFTRDLLLGLKGEDPSVTESIGGRWVVTTNTQDASTGSRSRRGSEILRGQRTMIKRVRINWFWPTIKEVVFSSRSGANRTSRREGF